MAWALEPVSLTGAETYYTLDVPVVRGDTLVWLKAKPGMWEEFGQALNKDS